MTLFEQVLRFIEAVGKRLTLTNDNAARAVTVTQNGDEQAMYIEQGAILTDDEVVVIYSNIAQTDIAKGLLLVKADNTAYECPMVQFVNDGSGTTLHINDTGNGAGMDIDKTTNSATATYGIKMTLANAGAGLEYAFDFDGSEIVSAAVGGTQDKKIRIKIGTTDYFIPCNTA